MTAAHWHIRWKHGSAEVIGTAAVLWDCAFRLSSGRIFRPFARAPWADKTNLPVGLPGHMRKLGGEFVCLPFGSAETNISSSLHGPPADQEWTLISADDEHVRLRLEYPADHEISAIEREIRAELDACALKMTLAIEARRPCERTIGLHPIVRIPHPPDRLQLQSNFSFGLTAPATALSVLEPASRFTDLTLVPQQRGKFLDFSNLSFDQPREELIQLFDVEGSVRVIWPDEFVTWWIEWNAAQLPSCLLWLSDSAMSESPWNRSFRGLGIEPAAAFFEEATEDAIMSASRAAPGTRGALHLSEGWTEIRYRMGVEEIA